MLLLSPQLLIATARSFVGLGVHGEHPFGAPAPDEPNAEAAPGTMRRSWDMALIQHCGYWAHYDHRDRRSSWPLPKGMTTPELATFGDDQGILYEAPEAGDIFLQYSPRRKTHVHVGIVVTVLASGQFSAKAPYFDIYALEGDTDELGRLGGGRTMRVRRRLHPAVGDCFLRWTELDAYDAQLARSLSPLGASARRSA